MKINEKLEKWIPSLSILIAVLALFISISECETNREQAKNLNKQIKENKEYQYNIAMMNYKPSLLIARDPWISNMIYITRSEIDSSLYYEYLYELIPRLLKDSLVFHHVVRKKGTKDDSRNFQAYLFNQSNKANHRNSDINKRIVNPIIDSLDYQLNFLINNTSDYKAEIIFFLVQTRNDSTPVLRKTFTNLLLQLGKENSNLFLNNEILPKDTNWIKINLKDANQLKDSASVNIEGGEVFLHVMILFKNDFNVYYDSYYVLDYNKLFFYWSIFPEVRNDTLFLTEVNTHSPEPFKINRKFFWAHSYDINESKVLDFTLKYFKYF